MESQAKAAPGWGQDQTGRYPAVDEVGKRDHILYALPFLGPWRRVPRGNSAHRYNH